MDLGEIRQLRQARRTPARPQPQRPRRTVPAADSEHHWRQTAKVDKSFVLGFKSQYLKANIPNRYVADYVSKLREADRFAGIDPTERGAAEEVAIAKNDLKRAASPSPRQSGFPSRRHPRHARIRRG